MKSISHGTVSCAHQVGHEEDGALEHADEQEVAPVVVGRDLRAERGHPCAHVVLVDEDLPDARSTSSLMHPSAPARRPRIRAPRRFRARRRPRHRARRPATRRARALGTFASTSRSCTFLRRPARRSPGRRARTSRPSSSDESVHGAPLDRALQPQHAVLAHGPHASAEVGRLRARPGAQEVDERGLERPGQSRPLAAEREEVRVCAGVQTAQQRQDLVADQPPRRVGVGRVRRGPASPCSAQ